VGAGQLVAIFVAIAMMNDDVMLMLM